MPPCAVTKMEAGVGNRLEVLKLGFHGWKAFGRAGAGVIPAKGSFSGVATARNDGVVAMVHEKMKLGVAGASGDVRELRLAEPNARIQVANFVADAKFAEAVESVADIDTNVGVFLPVNHQRIGMLINLELRVAG